MSNSLQLPRFAIAALGLAAAVSNALAAQSAGATRWQALTGCWSPVRASQSSFIAVEQSEVVCVVPTSNADAVQLTMLAEGKIVSTDTIDASGREHAISDKGCTGVRRAQWSADERRVFLNSRFTCSGVASSTSAVLALTAQGEWLDVRGLKSGQEENVRIARYNDVGIPSGVPSEIARLVGESGLARRSVRLAAAAPIGATAVIEASRLVDASVLEAWVLERGQPFALDAVTLVALADAGVPGRVTDAMVAVSNPQAFSFARAEPRVARGQGSDVVAGRVIPVSIAPQPWGIGHGPYGYGSWYDPYLRNPYGYGSQYGSYGGYGSYGSGYYPPIIVVTGAAVTPRTDGQGQAVKGHGYTQRRDEGSNPPPSTGSTPSSTTSTSTSSGSQGSTSAPSSEPRTAKPRDP